MFTIKVGIMPGRINEVAVEGGTIADVLALESLTADGYEVRYNGETVSVDTELTANGTVLLVKQIKGNALVKVGVMPGRINEVAVEDNTTVAKLLEMEGLSSTGYEIRYNGETVGVDTMLDNDGTVLLVKQIKGN